MTLQELYFSLDALQLRYPQSKNNYYPEIFKKKVVCLHKKSGVGIRTISKYIKVGTSTLYFWKKNFENEALIFSDELFKEVPITLESTIEVLTPSGYKISVSDSSTAINLLIGLQSNVL